LPTIDLDDKTMLQANKVHDIPDAQRLLSEMKSALSP
jgi:hypothetical protein